MTNKIDDGGPAYPCENQRFADSRPGMSLRDKFAGDALQCLKNSWDSCVCGGSTFSVQEIANKAYEIADAMIAARKKVA